MFSRISAATQYNITVQFEKGHHLSHITQNNLQTHGQRNRMKRGLWHYQVGVTLKPQLTGSLNRPDWSENPGPVWKCTGGYLCKYCAFPVYVWETDKRTQRASQLNCAAQEHLENKGSILLFSEEWHIIALNSYIPSRPTNKGTDSKWTDSNSTSVTIRSLWDEQGEVSKFVSADYYLLTLHELWRKTAVRRGGWRSEQMFKEGINSVPKGSSVKVSDNFDELLLTNVTHTHTHLENLEIHSVFSYVSKPEYFQPKPFPGNWSGKNKAENLLWLRRSLLLREYLNHAHDDVDLLYILK